MTQYLGIGKAVYEILSTNQDITRYVGNNIYRLIAKNGTKFPYIIFHRESVELPSTKDFIHETVSVVELNIVSDKYNTGIEIADKVLQIFLNTKGTHAGIDIKKVEYISCSESYDDEDQAFVQTLTLKIINI